jgi:hypothetical protein
MRFKHHNSGFLHFDKIDEIGGSCNANMYALVILNYKLPLLTLSLWKKGRLVGRFHVLFMFLAARKFMRSSLKIYLPFLQHIFEYVQMGVPISCMTVSQNLFLVMILPNYDLSMPIFQDLFLNLDLSAFTFHSCSLIFQMFEISSTDKFYRF